MEKITIRETILKALQLAKWEIIESKTSKATTLKKEGVNYLYFVGKKASLRKGKCYSKSYSVNYDLTNFLNFIDKCEKRIK